MLTTTNQIMRKYLFITLTLITFLQSNQPAKAMAAELEKEAKQNEIEDKTEDDTIEDEAIEDDSFGDDPSRAKIEDFKPNLGKRWVK